MTASDRIPLPLAHARRSLLIDKVRPITRVTSLVSRGTTVKGGHRPSHLVMCPTDPGRRDLSKRTFGSTRKLPSGQWQASYWYEGRRFVGPDTFRTTVRAHEDDSRTRQIVLRSVAHGSRTKQKRRKCLNPVQLFCLGETAVEVSGQLSNQAIKERITALWSLTRDNLPTTSLEWSHPSLNPPFGPRNGPSGASRRASRRADPGLYRRHPRRRAGGQVRS